MEDLHPILGIDLGTTYTAMAVVDRFGKPVVLPNADGYPTTPSVVWFYEANRCVVGEEALKMAALEPHNVAQFVKRVMGDDRFALEFHGTTWSPTEISALILKKMRQDAIEALGRPVDRAVITVPAYFNSIQRQATVQAGRLAGFDVLSILNEPTAAAVSYGLHRLGQRRRLLVFDLGGGTFDVTVMEIQGQQLRTLATDGNAELGGKDFDELLVNHVAERFVEEFGTDPRDDPQSFQELRERCVAAKIALSSKPRTVVPVNHAGHRTVVRITRDEFAGLASPLLTQCAETCNIALEKAGLGWNDVDDLLLVGGSTRMPMVRQLLRSLAGRQEVDIGNPDECVAQGAALAAVFRHQPDHPALRLRRSELARSAPRARGVLAREAVDPRQDELPDVRIRDAASHPLGAIVMDRSGRERVANIIPEGCPLPVERRQRFRYPAGTTAVRLDVTEGVGERPDDVTLIGRVILDNLPPRTDGTRLEVAYRYGIDQILHVELRDLQTGRQVQARLDLRGQLGGEALEAARERVRQAEVA